MLYEEKDIEELHKLKHRWNNNSVFYNWKDNIITNNVTPYLIKNNLVFSFIKKIEKMTVLLIDNHTIIKNFNDWVVDKYYWKHPD
jgi:hypothetical protein